jgi:hypothetical protein
LYDLQVDPYETNSLIEEREFADVRDQLKLRLSQWMGETGDFLDMETNGDFHPRDWLGIALADGP